MGFWQVLVGHPRTAKQLLYLLFFVQSLFTFSESRNSRTDSCNRQTGRINGIDFLALIPGNGCKGMKALNFEDLVRTLVEVGGWYLVGGKSVIKWALYSQIDWIQLCRFNDFYSVPAFFIWHTRLYTWKFRSRLAAESLPQTFLPCALKTFFPKRFRYCVNTTCYLPTYWSLSAGLPDQRIL